MMNDTERVVPSNLTMDCQHRWVISYAHCDEQTVERLRTCQRCGALTIEKCHVQPIDTGCERSPG
ncbi:MAG: hypothetical protein OEY77_00320 [Nitrospira sp.]|nr:hypothetical protein [Nitrospira sp.]